MSRQPLVELGSPIAFRSVSLEESCYRNTLTGAWKVSIGGSDLGCLCAKPKCTASARKLRLSDCAVMGWKAWRWKRPYRQQGSCWIPPFGV